MNTAVACVSVCHSFVTQWKYVIYLIAPVNMHADINLRLEFILLRIFY
jgi:hypothetical protein